MPLHARSGAVSHSHGTHPTMHILRSGHRLKVSWIYATTCSAKVVENKSFGDWTNEVHV